MESKRIGDTLVVYFLFTIYRLKCLPVPILILFFLNTLTLSNAVDSEPKCSDDMFAEYFNCSSSDCIYGEQSNVSCMLPADKGNQCEGDRSFMKEMKCRYCYQTERTEHDCITRTDCKALEIPSKRRYTTNCTVKKTTLCLGNRTFGKILICNWTSGYRWSTATLLSLTLGGFGVDRFYLGYWKEGLAKLFSFGGLGVWTLVDFILILAQYVGPSDGSLYIF